MQNSRNDQQPGPRLRITVTILFLLGAFSSFCKAAPMGMESHLPTLDRLVDSSKNTFNERIGSPIDLAWQAWLSQGRGPLLSEDPATSTRKITPKSIFIAPEASSGCTEQNNDEKRCKHLKTININFSLQRKFILDRLNAQHSDSQKHREQQQDPSKVYDIGGPFQLNIPFNDKGSSNREEPPKVPANTPKPQIIIPLEIKIPEIEINFNEKTSDSAGNEDTTTKIQGLIEKLPEHVPVVDFVHEDANEGFADSVVDYKIPYAKKHMEVEKPKEESDNKDNLPVEKLDIEQQLITTTTTVTPEYSSPTLVVLFGTTTKAPVTSKVIEKNQTMDAVAGNWTNEELFSSSLQTADEEHVNSHFPRNVTQDAIANITTQEADDVYKDEEPGVTEDDVDSQDYSTEDAITETIDDDFAETTEDELLKPGEAGMTIPVLTNQQLDKVEWYNEEDPVDKITSIETPRPESTVKPVVTNSTASAVEEAEVTATVKTSDADANISSEVSINGDFILETTLIDVNTEKIKNATEAAAINVDFVTVKADGSAEIVSKFEPEKEPLPKPEVVFSTSIDRLQQDQHSKPSSEVAPVIVWGVDEETAKKQNNNPLKLNIGLAPIQLNDTIVEQASYNSEKIVLPDPGQKFQVAPVSNYKPPSLGFVRFPSYEERPQHSPSYVRFPSDEVNSIHNLDFKPRLPHLRDEFVPTTSTKSSVPFFQKQSHWHRGSRTDRQHSGFKQHWSETNRQPKVKQQTHLQDFWMKMSPLITDSHHSTTSHGSNNEPYGGDTPRRSRFKPI